MGASRPVARTNDDGKATIPGIIIDNRENTRMLHSFLPSLSLYPYLLLLVEQYLARNGPTQEKRDAKWGIITEARDN